jgi:hypothetical protein
MIGDDDCPVFSTLRMISSALGLNWDFDISCMFNCTVVT